MQVILLEKIQKLGNLGDVADVKAGYARNYLIPKSKAKPATAANRAEFEAIKAELEAKAVETLEAAQALRADMQNSTCVIAANASDEGKLFGSINATNISASLSELGFNIEKSQINMPEAIRYVGEYDVGVTLHTDIVVAIKVVVQAA